MRTEIRQDGITHSGVVSLWDGYGRSLCGKKFSPGFKESFLFGDVNCPDCREAQEKGRSTSRLRVR